ncbi:IclR family transcriptional regulator [Haloarculaceae archaeon H-GB2-1]|nr:IclR family transcriptional regulator [Haloarculaceae archaeon H-GB1-1]MEA5388189.1 IclR family transcriptional regulator [Haloarculaceae archaeon H-GB11]MEA5406208.1 IclR family transcriptional regulator [Haloarculaceae archaeon H-GB2-1]
MGLGDDGRTLDAVETTLDVVQALHDLDGATLADLADSVDAPKSTLYYHLNTLASRGYVVQEGDEYDVGLTFLTHGARAKRRKRAYETIDQPLQDLAERTSAEADFAVEENGRLVVLSQSVGSGPNTGFLEGSHLYMTNTSAGKAILAEMVDDQIDQILDTWGLPQETPHSTTDREALFAELRTVREQGYAVNDEELMEGLRSVSAVVHDHDGSVLGAISVSGPTYRFTMDRIDGEIADLLLDEIESFEATLSQ